MKRKNKQDKKIVTRINEKGKTVTGLGVLLFVMTMVGLILGGVWYQAEFVKQPELPDVPICCDSGDGDKCHPLTGPGQTLNFTSPTSITFTQYKGVPAQYGLLKSNTTI